MPMSGRIRPSPARFSSCAALDASLGFSVVSSPQENMKKVNELTNSPPPDDAPAARAGAGTDMMGLLSSMVSSTRTPCSCKGSVGPSRDAAAPRRSPASARVLAVLRQRAVVGTTVAQAHPGVAPCASCNRTEQSVLQNVLFPTQLSAVLAGRGGSTGQGWYHWDRYPCEWKGNRRSSSSGYGC